MPLNPEIEAFEAEMLRAYVETVERLRPQIASAGLTADAPRLRRWNQDDPAAYGSEIEMNLLRHADIDHALDILLYVNGSRRDLTAAQLKGWLAEQIEGLGAPQA